MPCFFDSQCTKKCLGLWGLVNNAGLNFLGDAELTTMDQYVNQVSINQLGVVRDTKAFLPEIRRRKGCKSDTYFPTVIV